MPDLDEQRVARLARAIAAYLEAHPGSADSLTGIVQWWLPRDLASVDELEVRAAVDRLIGDGRVIRTRLPDGSEIYRRAARPPGGDDDTH